VTGFMRFEATTMQQVEKLAEGNPVLSTGGEVELLELIQS